MKATIVLTAAAVFVAIPAYAGSTNGNKPATAPGASGLTPGYQLNTTTPRPAQGASSFAPDSLIGAQTHPLSRAVLPVLHLGIAAKA